MKNNKKTCLNSRLLSLINKSQLSTMLSLESTLLRPTPKIAIYSVTWYFSDKADREEEVII